MKILLTAINAKYIHSNLAVYSLQAYADPEKEDVSIAEFTINNEKDYILEEIYRRKPDILCFSVYIWNLDYVESTAREFHKLCPRVPIWVGGPEVSFETKEFLNEHPYITGIMIGEGEETFRELCDWYRGKRPGSLKEIAGLTFRTEECEREKDHMESAALFHPEKIQRWSSVTGQPKGRASGICVTAPRPPMNMSEIPFAYRTDQDFSNRIIYYESSRGCPFSCSYCLSSVDKHLRFRDTELVKKELQFFIDQKVPQIKFVDRTFNCNHRHAMEIWQYLIDHDNGITNFHFEIAADLLNEQELNLIATMRPGLIQLEIGVQSTNPDTIRDIHRTMNLEELKSIVNRIHAGGNIHQHLDLIAGLPEEDYDSFRRSFDEIYALKPNQLQLGFLKVLKGSRMYLDAKEFGISYHDRPPYEVLATRWLSYDDVIRIKRVEEMLEVYYNSGQFEVTMKILETLFRQYFSVGAFDLFQRLGDFYDRKGYFGMSHSRLRRCEILLEFLDEQMRLDSSTQEKKEKSAYSGEYADTDETIPDPDIEEKTESEKLLLSLELVTGFRKLLEESLLFDLYYRENCKSRPSWAVDPSTFKRMTKEYCKNGKLSHVEPFHYRFPDKTVISLRELPAREESSLWVKFYYDRRDPLDHQAFTEYVEAVHQL